MDPAELDMPELRAQQPGQATDVPAVRRPGMVTTTQPSPRCDLAALRARVRQARTDYYEAACDHGDMTGHEAQQERAFGRVEALDEVLGMLAEGERQEQLAADLGSHADLADPVHGHDVFSRIEASTHE